MSIEHLRRWKEQGGQAVRKARAKPKDDPETARRLAILKDRVPDRYKGLVDRIGNGSQAAGIKLFCAQCVGFLQGEVRVCSAICPLWPFRPYQPRQDGTGLDVIDGPEGETGEGADDDFAN